MPVLLLPVLPDRPANIVETSGLWACHSNLVTDLAGTARYVTRSVVRRNKGRHGGIPKMPVQWHGPEGNLSGSVLFHAQVSCCSLSSDGPMGCTDLPSLSVMFGKADWKIIPILQEDDAYASGH